MNSLWASRATLLPHFLPCVAQHEARDGHNDINTSRPSHRQFHSPPPREPKDFWKRA